MRKNLYLAGFILAAGLFAACSSESADNGGNGGGETKQYQAVFISKAPAAEVKQATTRTTGVYNGHAIDFSWTPNDKLWIHDGTDLVKNSGDDITGVKASAKFFYDRGFHGPSYPVRFTGTNAVRGDQVTIAANQTQAHPNDASHIGQDGDCGTALATQVGDTYTFHLAHKAAYITFMPWYGQDELAPTVSVREIKLTIDAAANPGKSIAGTFSFDDNGLGTLVSGGSNTIVLKLSGEFLVPKTADRLKNAAIMVVNPGTYKNVTISYTLTDTKTNVTGTVSQTFDKMTFNVGKNRPVAKQEMAMKNYKPNYYQWDAGKPYWDGYTGTIPVVDGERGNYQPGLGNDRYMNSNPNAFNANNICASALNVNEAALYTFFGDSHWDGDLLWTMNKHLYKGGLWLKKLKYITVGGGHTGFTHPVYDIFVWNRNYIPSTGNTYWNSWSEGNVGAASAEKWTTNVSHTGKPSDIDKYFFLPAMGYLTENGTFKLHDPDKYGYYGTYWTSNGVVVASVPQGLNFHFNDKKVGINIDDRRWSYPVIDGTTYEFK